MGNIRLYGDTSGYIELAPPSVGPNATVTLPSTGYVAGTTFAATAPLNPNIGAMWLNTTTEELAVYDGTAWQVLPSKVSPTFTGTVTVSGNATFTGITEVGTLLEAATISATAASGTVTYDLLANKSVTVFTSNASANWVFNIRGNSTTTLNSLLSVGESLTVVLAVPQGATAYYTTATQIDGTATGVTTRWQTVAPSSGNPNSTDLYSYTIIKTAATPTYTVFASQTKFV